MQPALPRDTRESHGGTNRRLAGGCALHCSSMHLHCAASCRLCTQAYTRRTQQHRVQLPLLQSAWAGSITQLYYGCCVSVNSCGPCCSSAVCNVYHRGMWHACGKVALHVCIAGAVLHKLIMLVIPVACAKPAKPTQRCLLLRHLLLCLRSCRRWRVWPCFLAVQPPSECQGVAVAEAGPAT
jgi:hypothetical protein